MTGRQAEANERGEVCTTHDIVGEDAWATCLSTWHMNGKHAVHCQLQSRAVHHGALSERELIDGRDDRHPAKSLMGARLALAPLGPDAIETPE